MEIVTEMIQQCLNENAKVALNQEEYQKRYDGLVQKFNATKASLETVSEALKDKVTRRKTMERFLLDFKKQDTLLTDFDPLLRRSLNTWRLRVRMIFYLDLWMIQRLNYEKTPHH